MHFSDMQEGQGTKFTKIAIVSALHLAVGAALIHNMDAKVFPMPKAVEEIIMFNIEAPKPPPPPPEPPQPKQKAVTPPKVFTPPVEVEVAQEPPPEAVQATTIADPVPAEPGPVAPEAPPSNSTNTGEMFSAALANASDCAKPDYPASAARNGETGTVKMALLIGPDGRVSDSKIQHSSGSRELDRAAVAALRLCKFKPAMANGAPQSAWGQIAYVWTLE
ncbi:energy transducer TonB [Massilia sp. CF038]|uniref:energy transducer TonB n=1 Tax=Massilia sp. CF038 TaxID=1881045 RepID=UPI0009224EA3|nr:energy transducer TonB [Massilia sp. CF038]SHH69843.1 outer membrane transport energization protein TonB [Massilia sp. CF038]